MKTISGKVISSKPISLSRAAKNLSGFAGHENGASDAISVYLQRAADAFNNLVSFHKELKNPHSLRKHRTSHVKIEENLDAGKVEILESREKRKKIPDFKEKIEEPLDVELKPDLVVGIEDGRDLKNKRKGKKNLKESIKLAQFADEVGEEMEENKHKEEKVKIEESMDVEHATPDQVEEKRKKKKHKNEKMKNEEPVKIEQSPNREAGEEEETKVLDDEGGKGTKYKQEIARIMQQAGEIEEGSAKKGRKKKRKNRDSEDGGRSVEVEERKSREIDGGDNIDLAEQNSKKKRKRRKTEGDN